MENNNNSTNKERFKELHDINLTMLMSRLVARLSSIEDDQPAYYESQVAGLLIILRNVNRVYKGSGEDDDRYRSDSEFIDACFSVYGEDDKEMLTEEDPFQSPSTGKRFDPAGILEEIQTVLRDKAWPDNMDNDISTEMTKRLATLGMVLDGLNYQWQNDQLGDYLVEDDMFAINSAFYDLKEVIDIREGEHKMIWDLALHGEVNPDHSRE